MKKTATTIFVDLGILLALVAISFGLWYCPWITLLLLALFLLGGCLSGQHSR
jgi:hypothetical protein